jgi:colanic acid/amylovoran biosynthesis glycosyltransferase
MQNKRRFLYLIVSHYPYGFGEPFLEDELVVIASRFEKIYLIIPEPFKADKTQVKFHIPTNAEIVELQIQASGLNKLMAASAWFSSSWRLERNYIKKVYRQKFNVLHLKLMLSYEAFANLFEERMNQLIKEHAHPENQIVLYTYWLTNASYGLSKLKKRIPQLHIVSRSHRWDCFFYVNPGNYLPFRPSMVATLDGIYPISDAGTNYLRNQLPGTEISKIQTSRLGVFLEETKPNLSKKPNHLRILSIAFISQVKRIDRIIDALAIIENCTIEWTHIGSSPNMNDPIFEMARQKLSSQNHIQYHFAGEQSKEQVYNHLRSNSSDVLLCTSESEGIPVSMMEAIGFGLPIISVDVGGIAELVIDGENGELMDADASSSEIAAVIEKWARLDENEFEILSSKAYSNYLKYFSAPKNYLKFYSEILNP